MDFVVQILLVGDARFLLFVFLITGVMIYLVDYKKFSQAKGRERETQFCKRIAELYIGGSVCMLLTIQLLGWFL